MAAREQQSAPCKASRLEYRKRVCLRGVLRGTWLTCTLWVNATVLSQWFLETAVRSLPHIQVFNNAG